MRSTFWNLVIIGAGLVFFTFLLYPMYEVFKASFLPLDGAGFSLDNYRRFFRIPYYWTALFNSLLLALEATLISVAMGVPLAYLVGKTNVYGKTLLRTLGTLPVVLPTFVGAYAWVLLFGRSGVGTQFLNSIGIPFTSIYGWWGIVIVYAFTYYPFVFLLTLGALRSIDPAVEEAGMSLGSSPWRTIRTVTLPVVMPSVLSGALLVFMQSVENFGVPAIIGEGLPVLATRAYQLFINEMGSNPSMASTLSMILIACTSGTLLLQRLYLVKKSFFMKMKGTTHVIELRPVWRWVATGVAFFLCFLPLAPFIVVTVMAFLEYRGPVVYPNFTWDNVLHVMTKAPRPIYNSYWLSAVATGIVTVMGVLIGYVLTRFRGAVSTVLDVLVMLPFVIAGTVYGLALVVSFNTGPLILTGTPMILIVAFVMRKLPFVVRSSSSILYQIGPSVEEASISLGVPPMATFSKVTLRLMLAGIASGAILAWVTILAELSSSIVLYTAHTVTLPIVIYQAITSSDYGTGSAYALILIVSTLIPLFIANKLAGETDSLV